jgi:transcriptional regulator with XRE-family HTH domain
MTTSRRKVSQVSVPAVDMPALGARVKRFRCARGLSQVQLATQAGIDALVVSRLERGTKPGVAVQSAVGLAHVLGLTMDQFCGLAPAPDPDPAKTLPPLERPDTLPQAPCAQWESRRVLAACLLAWHARGYTYQQIADSLNGWGIETGNRQGRWTPTNLFRWLGSDLPHSQKGQRELLRTYGPKGTRVRRQQAPVHKDRPSPL